MNMSTGESKDDREKRISTLWGTLDVRKQGQIDLKSLKRSFKRIDHRKLCLRTWSRVTAADD